MDAKFNKCTSMIQGGKVMSFNSNFSSLFSGFGGSTGGTNLNWLGDYASIKNGSYGRLLKACYKESNSDSSVKKSTAARTNTTVDDIIAEKMKKKEETAESKAYTKVQSTTDKLKESADKLLTKGDSSVFEKEFITTTDENGLESTEYGYDKEAIYSAVNSFVTNYNSVLEAAGSVSNSSIANRVTNMEEDTLLNKQTLNQLGITIKADNTLAIDKDTFMQADMSKAENLFNGTGSYGYRVSASASMINYTANYEQLRTGTYTYSGTFNSANNTGSTINSSL